MTRNIALILLPLLALSACGTKQEQCIQRNTTEFRTVSALLAEVEGNLARGYAWEERQVMGTEWSQCRRYYRTSEGDRIVRYHPCLRDTIDTERYRVPIDPASEQRKRDNLAARKSELSRSASAVIDACRAAYPEDEK